MNKNFIKVVAAVLSLSALLRADNALKLVGQSEISVNKIAEINTLSYRSCYSKPEPFDVPDYDTSFKTYMNYKAITNKNSKQYKLQKLAYTDEDGIRRVDGDICVAVGSAYADSIGDRLEITLESGNTFTAVVGDFKADCDTDPENMYYPVCEGMGDVVEFITDVSKLDRYVRLMGSIGALEKYSGCISSVVPIE